MAFLAFGAIYYLNQYAENGHFLLIPVINQIAPSSGASSSMPHIHSSILYAVVGILITFIVLWGCPGSLAFVLFSTTASAMAQ